MAKVLNINPDVIQFYIDNAEIPFEVLQSKWLLFSALRPIPHIS